MPRKFAAHSTIPSRALQIYLILIGLAHNRQTITYGQLAALAKYGKGGVFARQLGRIMTWCDQEGLPPLTVLVVNKDTGIPGTGLNTLAGQTAPEAQQHVFRYPWFSIFPPTVAELKAAKP